MAMIKPSVLCEFGYIRDLSSVSKTHRLPIWHVGLLSRGGLLRPTSKNIDRLDRLDPLGALTQQIGCQIGIQ
jgi:hypothetical protein